MPTLLIFEELEAKLQIEKNAGTKGSSDITVTAFPNPVKDKLNFNVQNSQEALFSLQIYDASGKLLNTKNIITSETINIRSLKCISRHLRFLLSKMKI